MNSVAASLKEAGWPATVHATDGGDLLQCPEVAQASLLVCTMVPCGAREMAAMPALRGIVSPLLGFDWIDIDEATRRSIPVVNTETPESRESMAEATIMLVLALLYRLKDSEAQLRGGGERVQHRSMLKGRTLGIVGYGGISRELIRRLENWQPDVLVHTRTPPASDVPVAFVSLEHLLRASDVVLLMTRLDDGRRHLLDRRRLQSMKPGVLLVNTARGGLIDESALVEALQSGQVGAAALDVFEVEPLPGDHALRRLPNVILTPHAVGHTDEALQAIPRMAAANVKQLMAGQLPASCKNNAVEAAWTAFSSHR
jgi:phosphoglycerate dehydrogenase-like enzyme